MGHMAPTLPIAHGCTERQRGWKEMEGVTIEHVT